MEEKRMLLSRYDMKFYFVKKEEWFIENHKFGKYILIKNKVLKLTLDVLLEIAIDCDLLDENGYYELTNTDLDYILNSTLMELNKITD